MQSLPLDIDAKVIQSPCTVPWESMSGDDVKRYCGQCRLHVHDVSQMTRAAANALLRETNGNCCLRIWRRPDGRVITKDCNRVVKALRRRMRVLATAAASLLAVLTAGCCGNACVPDCPPDAPRAKPPAPPPVAPPPKPPAPGATVTTGK